jgi:hypothetical protein
MVGEATTVDVVVVELAMLIDREVGRSGERRGKGGEAGGIGLEKESDLL